MVGSQFVWQNEGKNELENTWSYNLPYGGMFGEFLQPLRLKRIKDRDNLAIDVNYHVCHNLKTNKVYKSTYYFISFCFCCCFCFCICFFVFYYMHPLGGLGFWVAAPDLTFTPDFHSLWLRLLGFLYLKLEVGMGWIFQKLFIEGIIGYLRNKCIY